MKNSNGIKKTFMNSLYLKSTSSISVQEYLPLLIILALVSPTLALAQPLGGLKSLLVSFKDILNLLIPVLFGICLIYFFWGLAQFILHDAGNDKTRADGKQKMIWGIVALFVFVSIYGILNFIGSAIGITPTPGRTLPPSNNSGSSGFLDA